jgi:putative ABC transport system permease protein
VRGADGEGLSVTKRRATLALLQSRLDSAGVTRVTPLARQASNEILEGDLQGIGSMTAVVPTVFLIVGTLLINVFLQRMVRNRRTVIGTLKALGYSDASIFFHFLKFGLIVGGGSAAAGVGLGLVMAYGLVLVFDVYYQFPSLPFEPNALSLILAASLGLGAAATGATFAARSAMRLAPAAAMRPASPEIVRGGGVSSWAVWRTLPLQIRIGVRNALRAPGRAGIGIFASAMGTALLVCGLMLTSSQDALIEVAFKKQERHDLEVVLKDVAPLDELDTFRRLPGVDRAEPKLDLAVEFLGRETREGAISGLSSDAVLTRLYDANGVEFRLPERGVVLSSRLAGILGVEVGEPLRFRTLTGERREYVAPVAAVTETFLGAAAYARIESLAEMIRAEPHLASVQLAVAPGAEDRLKREIAAIPGVESTVDRRRIGELLDETLLRNQTVFVVVLVGFAGTIFFGGSLNAALVNLEERRRETATWRALGYDPWEIGFQFFVESATVQALGVAFGVPLGWALALLAAEGAATDVLRLPIVVEPLRIGWALVAAGVFTLLAHAVVQRLIFRLNLLESLKTRE